MSGPDKPDNFENKVNPNSFENQVKAIDVGNTGRLLAADSGFRPDVSTKVGLAAKSIMQDINNGHGCADGQTSIIAVYFNDSVSGKKPHIAAIELDADKGVKQALVEPVEGAEMEQAAQDTFGTDPLEGGKFTAAPTLLCKTPKPPSR